MERIDLKRLFEMLREEGIDFFDNETGLPKEHWLCPKGYSAYRRRNLIKKIFSTLGISGLFLNYCYPRKQYFCQHSDCVNPACFSLAKRKGNKNIDMMDETDIEELAEELNLDEWKRLGTKEYFNYYNSQQPDFLKVTEEKFIRALVWKKGSEL